MSIFEAYKPDINNPDSITMQLGLGLGISRVTAELLVNRGITCCDKARHFLNPNIEQLHDPFCLSGMDAAMNRIKAAIENNEKITVYGDYDVDGLTSSTILYLFLKSRGAEVDIYIPNRLEEGYGLNKDALLGIINSGTTLIVTVDCGITAIDEVELAKSHNVDIIITDHHNPGPAIPDALAVINPKLNGSYPFTELAGVGVAAKLIQALGGLEAVMDYLDLIAIGTIADIVPLVDENRVFAAEGLKLINNSPRLGIKALIQTKGFTKAINSSNISFGIAPALNAPGRLSTFDKGFELLISQSFEAALPIAQSLVDENETRREIERSILESVKQQIAEQVDLSRDKLIIVAGEGWHSGVIGIVASKITEIYNRPSIIISLEGDTGSGSARSIKGFDLYRAMSTCKDLFLRFGGHEYAAGLSIKKDNINNLKERLLLYAENNIPDEMLIPHYTYDGVLRPDDITPGLHSEIDLLAPFGMGNPAPKFLLDTATVENSTVVGKNSNHLKLALELGQRSWDAIGFGMAEAAPELYRGCPVSLLASISLNEWMGVSKTQFEIHCLKRLYKSVKEIEGLLSLFDYKFFNAFLSQFIYNNSVARAEIGNMLEYKSVSIDNICDALKGSPIGTVVLVFDSLTAKGLLKELMDRGILDRTAISYNKPDALEGIGNNAVILAPDIMKIPFNHYHNVLVADDVDKKSLLNRLSINRRELEQVYKWIRRLIPGRNVWQSENDMLEAFNNEAGMDLSGFQLMLALEVFKELGFLEFVCNGRFIKASAVKNPVSRSLGESKLLTYHSKWLEQLFAYPDKCINND